MKNTILLEQFPNVVTEILLRLKIRDAMSTSLMTASPYDTLRKIQNIMREHKVSGIPVTQNNKLCGIISVDDIISALDKGYIEETAEKHMTRKIIALEDEMPLTMAIAYFNKYSYGRFPVIDKKHSLCGILTSRDILSRLVAELNREINAMENKVSRKHQTNSDHHLIFPVKRFDFENAGKASFEIKKILTKQGVHPKIIRRVSIASYELEINIAIHSKGGELIYEQDTDLIKIIARDFGPGIKDIEKAVREGYSTANEWIRSLGFGAGMGLPNVKRVSDIFDIQSKLGKGTTVSITIDNKTPKVL